MVVCTWYQLRTKKNQEKSRNEKVLTEHLNDTTLLIGLDKVLHGELALRDLELAPLTGQGQDTVTGDTGQDLTVQFRGDQLGLALLVLPVNKAVHGADLSDLMVLSKQPQVLLESFLVGIQLRLDARGIVASDLGITSTTGPGTDLLGRRQQVHGRKAGGEVRTDGGSNDKDHSLVGSSDTQGFLGTNHGRAQVQGVAATLGDPTIIHLQELANQLCQLFAFEALIKQQGNEEGGGQKERGSVPFDPFLIENISQVQGREGGQFFGDPYGKGNAISTAVETLHVHVRTEETGLSILVLVSLHALKALKGVMENDGRRVQVKLSILLDLGLTPTLTSLPLDCQHVVGKSLAKDQLGIGLESLLLGRLFNLEFGSVQRSQLGAVEAGEGRGGEDLGAVGGRGGGEGVVGLDGLAHCSLDKHCDERQRRKEGWRNVQERRREERRMEDLKKKKRQDVERRGE